MDFSIAVQQVIKSRREVRPTQISHSFQHCSEESSRTMRNPFTLDCRLASHSARIPRLANTHRHEHLRLVTRPSRRAHQGNSESPYEQEHGKRLPQRSNTHTHEWENMLPSLIISGSFHGDTITALTSMEASQHIRLASYISRQALHVHTAVSAMPVDRP